MKNCPECGATQDADAKFCFKCGHEFAPEPQMITCPRCHTRQLGVSKFCYHCGFAFGGTAEAAAAEQPAPQPAAAEADADQQQTSPQAATTAAPLPGGAYRNGRQSFFDGGLLSWIGCWLLAVIVTVCTFGICLPWGVCILYGWRINHTVVDGYRMHFSGTAIGLFGNWIKWWLLTAITFGIYGFWVFIKLEDWKVKHTQFLN